MSLFEQVSNGRQTASEIRNFEIALATDITEVKKNFPKENHADVDKIVKTLCAGMVEANVKARKPPAALNAPVPYDVSKVNQLNILQ